MDPVHGQIHPGERCNLSIGFALRDAPGEGAQSLWTRVVGLKSMAGNASSVKGFPFRHGQAAKAKVRRDS
jgi:hypothetical protein